MRKSSIRKRLLNHWELYAFLLLPAVYLLVFSYYPMLGAQIAFRKFSASQGIWFSPWVGLKYFIKFFNSYQFTRVVGNTLRLSFYSIIAGFPVPILFALLLNSLENRRFKNLIQTVTYMPHFISAVVIVGMLMQILNPINGVYGQVYGWLNNGSQPADLFSSALSFPNLYVWSGVWQEFGWDSIIYIAALSAVSPELHEAAQIDGASRFKRILHIDFPAIIPTMTILLILRAGSIMSIGFEKAFLMQNDLNLQASEVISTYIYKICLKSNIPDFSYSTAIGLFNSLVNLTLIATVNWFTKKISQISLW